MKKSARVSEKLVSPGLPGLQVATRLVVIVVLVVVVVVVVVVVWVKYPQFNNCFTIYLFT